MGGKASYLRCVSGLALSAAAVFGASAARADAAGDRQAAVSELVVTAERRVENLQTTAISATVLDQKTLEAKGVTGLTTLQFAAPVRLVIRKARIRIKLSNRPNTQWRLMD